jgi:hypothetical protein
VARGKVGTFPGPGTRTASPRTQLTFRGVPARQVRHIRVTGSRSGPHRGTVEADSDGRGASFLPARPFDSGERVTVRTPLAIAGAHDGTYAFTVSRPLADTDSRGNADPPPVPAEDDTFHSAANLDPPLVRVTRHTGTTAPGDVLVAPKDGQGANGPMIFDNRGRLVWFHPVGTTAFGLQEQRYRGRPVLTWWQGVRYGGHGHGVGIVVNRHYHRVARVAAGNGYHADLHYFQLTPRGTTLLLAYQPERYDLSPLGGPKDGAVLDSIVQEIDIKTGLVLFEWHSLDHIPLRATHNPHPASAAVVGHPLDYFHVNSVGPGPGGSLLISSRETWALYDLDRHTGAVRWRLGGKCSDFHMAPGTRTAWQHDARWHPPDTITVFDNGATPQVERQSRALILHVDLGHRRVTRVAQDNHRPPIVAGVEGSVQLLPGGDVGVGWGNNPDAFTEFDRAGRMVFDAHFLGERNETYQAFRAPWHGRPTTRPAIAVAHGTVYASWNGATGVARWQLLSGRSRDALHPVGPTVARGGFETALGRVSTGRWVAARALDARGRVLARSRALRSAASPAIGGGER